VGVAAWTPLVAWNMDNADAGLRFQLVDRHPWAFHGKGAWFVLIQALLVTPLLFAAMAVGAVGAWRGRSESARLLAALGGLVVLGFLVLGFFADTRRVSFHWPLPAYLALLPLVPAVLARWPRPWRMATWSMAAAGLLAILGYYSFVSVPAWRAQTSGTKWYPANFAGWNRLADAVRTMQASLPAGTPVLADNFKIGAELGFALRDPRILVLDHPLNRDHGRAPQLSLWGLRALPVPSSTEPVLLVLGPSDLPYRDLLQRYHALCGLLGALPAPRVLDIDNGGKRFLLFGLDGSGAGKPCTAPAMAWIDSPASGARVGQRLEVQGWAFKDGVGLSRVEVLVNGQLAATADYGLANPGVAAYWGISTDPQHPHVGFRASVDTSGLPAGRHWLGLRLHGRDGSVEDWSEQPVRVDGGR
jgi:hypothetical protein